MTDDEIVKKLDILSQYGSLQRIYRIALHNAIYLINRQKAENERLKKENAKQKAIIEAIDNEMMPLPFETDFDKAIKTAKSEAIKEFCEKRGIEYVEDGV